MAKRDQSRRDRSGSLFFQLPAAEVDALQDLCDRSGMNRTAYIRAVIKEGIVFKTTVERVP